MKKSLKKKQKCRERIASFQGKQLLIKLVTIISRHFPTFFEDINNLDDHRKFKYYEVREIVFSCISMFLFKNGSRNKANNNSIGDTFKKNFKKVFGFEVAHGDTVCRFMSKCSEEDLELVKRTMLKFIIENKTLRKFLLNNRYVIAIDGTQVYTFKEKPFEGCQKTEHKSGKITWHVNVLEAKIICKNGFCLSIATQWQENEADYIKQDCEQKAFVKIAEKIKKFFPRLPICIIADGLYPNNTVLSICKKNNWNFIITLKDGNLKTIQKKIDDMIFDKKFDGLRIEKEKTKNKNICDEIMFINTINYKSHKINYFNCLETETDKKTGEVKETNFAYITDIKLSKNNIYQISQFARWRWKIENEGFNVQKNSGYNLSHKYVRKNFTAIKNYYQCLQIAHLINQMLDKTKQIKEYMQIKITIKYLWERMLASMLEVDLNEKEIMESKKIKTHFIY
jgi:hypothetical protein